MIPEEVFEIGEQIQRSLSSVSSMCRPTLPFSAIEDYPNVAPVLKVSDAAPRTDLNGCGSRRRGAGLRPRGQTVYGPERASHDGIGGNLKRVDKPVKISICVGLYCPIVRLHRETSLGSRSRHEPFPFDIELELFVTGRTGAQLRRGRRCFRQASDRPQESPLRTGNSWSSRDFALHRALGPPSRTHFSLLDPTPRRGSRRHERREE